ncbi:PRC-barrel domain-containing protein [Pikeienuella sp. HZG-20]|uniref:PRC-barrel domain-containing protein n=1 Tax=Paludibacillus litoralis TaxID=3133267 RepID=UPI0030ECE23C
MKRILATTALVGLLSAPAFAPAVAQTGSATESNAAAMTVIGGGEITATDLVGRTVYVGQTTTEEAMADADAEWEDIGEVDDVVLSKDGGVEAVLVDVGGFLGMGEHTVAVDMDTLRFIQDADDQDDVFVVSALTREELEALPEYDKTAATGTESSAARMTTDDAATKDGVKGAAVGAAAGAAAGGAVGGAAVASAADAPAVKQARWVDADMTTVTVEELRSAAAYSADDQNVGEIDDLIVNNDGRIKDVIVDVGGFLGMGEKAVLLPFDDVKVMQMEGGDDLRVIVSKTREELDAMPIYEKKS